MVKFQVGDLVKYTGNGTPRHFGRVGNVRNADDHNKIEVRFDGDRHDCGVFAVNLTLLQSLSFHYPDCGCSRCANEWADRPGAQELARPNKKTDSQQRKETPIYSGPMKYFPLALAAIARLCLKANEKHNPGEPLHWSRHKSDDHLDCIARHLMDAGTMDEEMDELHDVALAWRALANLQLAEEKRLNKETK